jgi:hypothetical protein
VQRRMTDERLREFVQRIGETPCALGFTYRQM